MLDKAVLVGLLSIYWQYRQREEMGSVMLSTTERIGQKAKDAIDLTVQLAWQAGYDQAVKDMEEIESGIRI